MRKHLLKKHYNVAMYSRRGSFSQRTVAKLSLVKMLLGLKLIRIKPCKHKHLLREKLDVVTDSNAILLQEA